MPVHRMIAYICVETAARHAVDEQRGQLETWTAARHVEVLRIYVDVRASTPPLERPGLGRLLAEVAAGRADTVVCTALQRLARDQASLSAIARQLDAYDVGLVVTEQGIALRGGDVAAGLRAGPTVCDA